jgi:hypothetical protein
VQRFANLPKELDADEGELTRTRKLKREFIEQRYAALLDGLYGTAAAGRPGSAGALPGRPQRPAACARAAGLAAGGGPTAAAGSPRLRTEAAHDGLLNYIINGVLQGQLYALLALGFVVIYRASKVFNLAQGELMLLGAYMVWTLALGLQLPPWVTWCRWPSSRRWPAAG